MGVNAHCKSDLSFRWVSGGLRSTRWPPLLFFNPSPNDRPGPGVYFMYDPLMDFAGGDVSFIFHPLMEYLNCILGGCLGMAVSYEEFLCFWGGGGNHKLHRDVSTEWTVELEDIKRLSEVDNICDRKCCMCEPVGLVKHFVLLLRK